MRNPGSTWSLAIACLLGVATVVASPGAVAQSNAGSSETTTRPSGRFQRWDAGSGTLWVGDKAYPLTGEARTQFERNGRSAPLSQLEEGTIVVLHPVSAGGPVARIEVFEPKL